MIKRILILASVCTFSGCAVTRAESDYELNRRAGLPIPGEDKLNLKEGDLRTSSVLQKNSYMPARVPPVVERIWFFDKKIGNYWQQGTWVWVEVEPGRWLNDVDPGGAPLVLPALLPKPTLAPTLATEEKSQAITNRRDR